LCRNLQWKKRQGAAAAQDAAARFVSATCSQRLELTTISGGS
jgi:hypothetical protein